MVRRVLEDEHAGRQLDLRLDHLEHRALGRAVGLPLDQAALHVVVAAHRVELVLLVVIERGLVAEPLPHRVRVGVDVEVVRVVVRRGRGCGHLVSLSRRRRTAHCSAFVCGRPLKVTLLYGKRIILNPRRPTGARAAGEPARAGPAALAHHPGHARRRGGAVRRPGGGARRGDQASPTPSWPARPARFGAALVSAGVEPGDRVAIWCHNCAEWVVAVLGIFEAGAVLVPVNTRFKGAEAADILSRSGARVLVTVTDFLGTDYVAMLEDTGVALPALETIVTAHGGASRRAVPWRDFLAGIHARLGGRGAAPPRRPRPRRPLRHPLHLGDDGRPQGRRHDARPHVDRGHRLGRHDGPARRRRLPPGEPLLPHVRPQGRHPGQRRQRRHDAARAGLRRRPRPLRASSRNA